MNIHSVLKIENAGAHSTIRFFGFVDAGLIEKARPIVQAELPESCRNIIVDLSDVEFLDSHGVGFFASLLKKAHGRKGRLFFVAADGQPAAVLKMVGFSGDNVTYCETTAEAEQILLE